MDLDGTVLALIDELLFKVENQMEHPPAEEEIQMIHQQTSSTYNLHSHNDLYPHYPITQANKIKIPRLPDESDTSDLSEFHNTKEFSENFTKLDKLIQHSEKLLDHSEQVMQRLDKLEKILLDKQLKMLSASANGELSFGKDITNLPLQRIDENIPTNNKRSILIQTAHLDVKRNNESITLEDQENQEPNIQVKRTRMVGLSRKRRVTRGGKIN